MLNSLVNIYQEHFYISRHVSQLSCCEGQGTGSHTPAPWEVTTKTEPSWIVWPRSGVCWEKRDGRATPRLQGPSQCSPPGLLTFCQSLCCVFIDAKNQAGVRVFLSAPQSRISTDLGEKSCLLFLQQNIYQPWREILSAVPGNELCSLAHHTDARTSLFPSSGSRPVESILQMLWHSVLDITCRAWGSYEDLSWPFTSLLL